MMTTKEGKTVFIGFLLSEQLDDVLRLQSILQGTYKGTLIRDIVTDHVNYNGWDIETILDRFSRYLYNQWDTRWRDKVDFKSYIAKREIDLDEKYKLPERLIKVILQQCKDLHQKNPSANK